MTAPIAILGFGVTGQSVARHLLRHGQQPVVFDTRQAQPYDEGLHDVEVHWQVDQWPQDRLFERVVVSPGLRQDHCLVQGAAQSGSELVSDVDLFFEAVEAPVIGITGTNGKSTVTSLVGHMLQQSGVACGVGGNLGKAALDLLPERHEHYVLELSSFQLERSREHRLSAATVLNITEDHLDHHADMAEYAASKQRIYTYADHRVCHRADPLTHPRVAGAYVSFGLDVPVNEGDWGVIQQGNERWLAQSGDGVMPVSELPLAGAHNELNVMAACALLAPQLGPQALRRSCAGFSGLPHRFALVADIDGVAYINDSKATNVGATMAALDGLPAANQVVLIAGGLAKGVDITPLASVLRDRVKCVVAIGQDGPLFVQLADLLGIAHHSAADLPSAVQQAQQIAEAGDLVLLSPACASFDMFKSFGDRGEQFAAAVGQLGAIS